MTAVLIADSHEFIELYRGDKDVRIGMEMVRLRDDVRFVSFAPDRLSPIDKARFDREYMHEVGLPEMPERMEVRLLPSLSLRFSRKESGGIVSVMPSLGRSIRGLRPDIIFENPFSWLTPRSYQTYRASRALGVPVVYYDPGDDIPISRKHRIMATWERRVVNHASAIITYNEAGSLRFQRKYGYPAERIHVIPKPVDVQGCRWGGDVSELRSSFGAGPDTLVVGYLGRLARYKGSAYLLDVARSMGADPRVAGRVRFVFVGSALSSEESDDDYRLPNTFVTGMVPHGDVARHLAACDVVVLPDLTSPGGFSTAVAEAMAAARCLIVGTGDRTEFLPLVDGSTALLVESRSPEAIEAALRRVLDDPELRDGLAKAVGDYADREMDYPVVVGRYLEILEGALVGSIVDRRPALHGIDEPLEAGE
ncbi:MAG: glycosyltransferase family 4 protein [Actinobacteria bacterium]|nr:glycosyltransferase family 4 protein [Actinomycetota bacterium]MCG2807482.1 glycosyltransferase family 4 protein [Coriobacteriia bacterium]